MMLVKSILIIKMLILLLTVKKLFLLHYKHAPLKTDNIVPCDVQPWMTEEIMSARKESVTGSGSGEYLGPRFIFRCSLHYV